MTNFNMIPDLGQEELSSCWTCGGCRGCEGCDGCQGATAKEIENQI